MKPLAEIVAHTTVRLTKVVSWQWLVDGKRVGHDMAVPENAQRIADAINAAHEAAVSGLQARLAIAREALRAVLDPVGTMRNDGRPVYPSPHQMMVDALEAIDAADPGEWVPLEKLTEAHRIIADLREERRTPAQERIDRALAIAERELWWSDAVTAVARRRELISALQGREVEPARKPRVGLDRYGRGVDDTGFDPSEGTR